MMTNLELYKKIFMETFEIKEEELEGLVYRGIPEWDSVGHMTLIATLEDTYGIMMEMDDIIDFSSYVLGIELLNHYGVQMG